MLRSQVASMQQQLDRMEARLIDIQQAQRGKAPQRVEAVVVSRPSARPSGGLMGFDEDAASRTNREAVLEAEARAERLREEDRARSDFADSARDRADERRRAETEARAKEARAESERLAREREAIARSARLKREADDRKKQEEAQKKRDESVSSLHLVILFSSFQAREAPKEDARRSPGRRRRRRRRRLQRELALRERWKKRHRWPLRLVPGRRQCRKNFQRASRVHSRQSSDFCSFFVIDDGDGILKNDTLIIIPSSATKKKVSSFLLSMKPFMARCCCSTTPNYIRIIKSTYRCRRRW